VAGYGHFGDVDLLTVMKVFLGIHVIWIQFHARTVILPGFEDWREKFS